MIADVTVYSAVMVQRTAHHNQMNFLACVCVIQDADI